MARATTHDLTPDQQAESDRIYSALIAAADDDIRALVNQMASRTDATILGENEFTLRDIVLRVAAKGLEIALEGRKKGVRRVQPVLRTVRRVGPLRALAEENVRDRCGQGPRRAGVLSLPAL